MKKETRAIGEIRAVESEDQGIVTAYLTQWGTVDSYNSTFQRGAFRDSFKNRREKGRIKLLFNHETLAGKVISAAEDEVGPKVRVQFNLDTQAGRDAFSHVKAGDIDGFSFGFFVNRDKMKEGVRVIQEVDCLECGPVVFPANPEASIVDVREGVNVNISSEGLADEMGKILKDTLETFDESRSTDFDETAAKVQMSNRRWQLIDSLMITLEDIMYQMDVSEWPTASMNAIDSFQAAYVQWANDFLDMSNENGMRSIPIDDPLKVAFRELLDGKTVADFAADTDLTRRECETLMSGKFLDASVEWKLTPFEAFNETYQAQRSKRISDAMDGIKAALRPAERNRMIAALRECGQDDELLVFRKRIQELSKNLT